MSFGGVHLHQKGYAGSITITEGSDTATITPTKTASAWQILSDLAALATTNCAGTYAFSVANTGVVRVTSAATFSVSMSTEIQTLCNFDQNTYTSITNLATQADPVGSFHPYTDGDGIYFTKRFRVPTQRGVELYNGSAFVNCPGTNTKFPALSFSVPRTGVLDFLSKTQGIGTPSKVDVWDGTQFITLTLGAIRVRELDAIEGFSQIGLEVVE